jgi:hypothetical protein
VPAKRSRVNICVKMLERVGFTREQAETNVRIMTEVIETNLATKQDLKDLGVELDRKFVQFENKIVQLEYRLTIKGTIVSVAIGIAAAFIKLT